jgi:hypothetical protein
MEMKAKDKTKDRKTETGNRQPQFGSVDWTWRGVALGLGRRKPRNPAGFWLLGITRQLDRCATPDSTCEEVGAIIPPSRGVGAVAGCNRGM